MRIRLKPWAFLVLLALGAASIVFEIDRYRHRFVQSNSDLVALLPLGDATLFFANVAALRRARVLRLFAAPKTLEESEYREFVRQTHFDYTKDVESIAGVANGEQTLFVIRGRFDWSKLRGYAIAHGGACRESLCNLPTSKSGRWASFLQIQSDVMGLAVATNSTAVLAVSPHGDRVPREIPPQPVWIRISPTLLRSPVSVPVDMRIFAISLQSADRVLLSFDSGAQPGGTFILRLDAQCPSRATAETIRTQLDLRTKMLRMELAREHQEPSPSDFTGLLAAGTFQVQDKRVIGTWPIHKELLNTLE